MFHFKNKGLNRISEKVSLERLGLKAWLTLGFLTVIVNQRKYWADSEMWAVSATRDFFAGKPEFFFAIKPLFHFLLWINFKISQLIGLFPIDLARFLWSLCVVLILILCDRFLKCKALTPSIRILSLLLILSSSTWVFRSGEVRSDIMITLIILLILNLSQSLVNYKIALIFFGVIASTLITPKGILLWFCVLPLLFAKFNFHGVSLKKHKKTLIGLGIISIGFTILCKDFLLRAFKFFLSQFGAQEMGFRYFSLIRMEHILRFHIQNFHFSLILIFVLLVGVGLLCSKTKRNSIIAPFSSLVLTLGLFHFYPDPLPFFLAALIPIMAINVALILDPVSISLNKITKSRVVLTFSIIFGAFYFFWWSQLYFHTNIEQRELARWGAKNLDKPYLLVFDPTGFLVSSNSVQWFLGPGNKYNSDTLRWITENQPEIILFTDKLHYLGEAVNQLFSEHYVRFSTSIYLKSYRLGKHQSCRETYDELRSIFFRHVEHKTSLVLWGRGVYDEEFIEVPLKEQNICSLKLSEKMNYFFLPIHLRRVPGADLSKLFRYDSRF